MDIAKISAARYTTKHYNPNKKVSPENLRSLLTVLRNAPSSVNSQPWHFFVIGTDAGKAKILPAILDFNRPRIGDASHIIVFCAKVPLDENHLQKILEKEDADGRFGNADLKQAGDAGRHHFVGLNSETAATQLAWESKQIYIALGQLLLSAAALEVDSTAIEGFDAEKMDAVLDLKNQGLRSIVAAAIGHRSDTDANALRPKSRLPENDIFTFL